MVLCWWPAMWHVMMLKGIVPQGLIALCIVHACRQSAGRLVIAVLRLGFSNMQATL